MVEHGDDVDQGCWSYRVAYFIDERKWRLIEAYYEETVPSEIAGWCTASVDEDAASLDDLRNDVLAMVDAFTRPAVKIDKSGTVVGQATVPICRHPR